MRTMLPVRACGVLVTLMLAACSQQASSPVSEWSASDKENAAHFTYALETAQHSLRASSKGGTVLTEADRIEILKYWHEAVNEARAVNDTVLNKIHPELRPHLRDEFQQGLELRIKSLEESNAVAGFEASQLMDLWADWYIAHQREIRIPKP